MKPRILFMIDKPGWAYDQIADRLISVLGDKYDFYKDYQIIKPTTFKGFVYYLLFLARRSFYRRRFSGTYDVCVVLWWKSLDLVKMPPAKKTLVGIFTEGFPPGFAKELIGVNRSQFISRYLAAHDGVIAGNRNIFNFFSNSGLEVYYATSSTDTSIFNRSVSRRSYEGLRVCWTGNPNRAFKGFHDFVVPAVKLAQEKYPDITLTTKFSGPLHRLPQFYSTVDIMLNASIGDAGPGFILDAGACGVPTISTNTGFASELIIDGHNGYLVERSVTAMANMLIHVYENRSALEKMSRQIEADVVNEWSVQPRAVYWDQMFRTVLGRE